MSVSGRHDARGVGPWFGTAVLGGWRERVCGEGARHAENAAAEEHSGRSQTPSGHVGPRGAGQAGARACRRHDLLVPRAQATPGSVAEAPCRSGTGTITSPFNSKYYKSNYKTNWAHK